jgi:hypothetical protein
VAHFFVFCSDLFCVRGLFGSLLMKVFGKPLLCAIF